MRRLLPRHASSTDRLWIQVILAALLILGSAQLLPPNDLWWHARVGDEILQTGHIPRADAYSLTERGQPFFYQSWLAEVLMAGLLRLGGVRLLVLVRALITTSLYGTVLALCWRASGEDRRAAVATTLGALVLGFGNQTVRPQLFAYPLFIALYAILWRFVRGGARRSVWLIPVLAAIWVNTHGSFALGLGLIWLVFVGQLLSHALPALAGGTAPEAGDRRRRIKTLAVVVLLSTAALLINPRGVDIIGYVADLLTDAPSQFMGSEWQTPDPKAGIGQSFYLLLLLGMATLALVRPPVALTDLLLVLGFGWLAASGVRYVVWFGLVAAPVIAAALPRLPWEDLARRRDRLAGHALGRRLLYGDGSGYPGFRRLALGTLAIALLVVAVLFVFAPDDVWLTPYTGRAAVRFMERNGLQGRLFNELGRGSYVIWRLGPAQPVFIDPRFELYSLEHFQDYLRMGKAEPGAEALLAAHDFELLLLDRESQASLVALVDGQPGRWQRVYADDYTLLYRRAGE